MNASSTSPRPRTPRPIRSITAATDFSRHASLALKRAARLASGLDGKLDVIHVVDGPPLAQAGSKSAAKKTSSGLK